MTFATARHADVDSSQCLFLPLYPFEEVIHAGAADCHFEWGLGLCGYAQAAAHLFDDGADGFEGDYAAAGDAEEIVRVQFC